MAPKNPQSPKPPTSMPGGQADKQRYEVECTICGRKFTIVGTDLGEHKNPQGYLCYGIARIIKPVI